jgi:multidrug efflux pump subunit AcrA (membrane-fusion protein)
MMYGRGKSSPVIVAGKPANKAQPDSVTAADTAEPRPIEVGPISGNLTIVTAGVSEGEPVVTDGQYKLQRGVPVSLAGAQTAVAGETR